LLVGGLIQGLTFACKDANNYYIAQYFSPVFSLLLKNMIQANSYIYISDKIINWYNEHKRDLPWRDIYDPYRIWISEIILQQTRVNQGLGYYNRFIERFPTVDILSEADEDSVLKYWQGLGYYTRARNLHKAAQQIMSIHKGLFPTVYNDIIKLSGIGEYTAAAISSFAFHKPYAVVDGNVYRVLSRLFNIQTPINTSSGKKEFTALAQNLLSKSQPGLHNQAFMEFGALQCTPTTPDCLNCPLNHVCSAYENKLVLQLPIKSAKKKPTLRFFNYLNIRFEGNTYIQKRVISDIWQNLFEFPLIESDRLLSTVELMDNAFFKSLFRDIDEVEIFKISNPVKHILSHRVIFAQFISINISGENESLNHFSKVPLKDIDNYAVSRLMELFLENEKI